MFGFVEDLFDGAVFGDSAQVHDGNFVRDLGDDAEVVGDEHHAHAGLLLEVFEQVEDSGLGGDVEGGGGFVGDEHCGVAGQRDGDHDALTHAAGELEGVDVEALFGLGDADTA